MTPSAPKTKYSQISKSVATSTKNSNLEDQCLSTAGFPSHAEETTLAKEHSVPPAAFDILVPYMGTRIIYASRKRLSSYAPSSLMMDYVIHQMNYHLVDNLHFRRNAPDYHPYIIRLYYAIIFWVQCLCAAHEVAALGTSKYQFLTRSLETHPLESLPVAGPLVPLFKTLCCSQPEILTYGKVYPHLPKFAGPDRRDQFVSNSVASFFLPNVPGIFALLEHLNSMINNDQPRYPKKGAHIPVPANAKQATIFGHHSFPASAARTPLKSWSLCSSGLQYPCEADASLNESFAERYSNFDFPATAANDCLLELDHYLSMDTSSAWFFQVKSVAAAAAAHFQDSGTLADCNALGIAANQIQVLLQNPAVPSAQPTCSADKKSLFPFAYRLRTSARSPPNLAEAMAAMAQTNIRMPPNHPYLSSFGVDTLHGDFWDISPLEDSSRDYSSYLAINGIVKKMMITKS